MVQSVIVENDGEENAIEGFGNARDYTKLSKEEIRNIIKEAGIVGLGGAGFPTHVKLTPKDEAAIDHVIVNGAECEPYLTSDYRVMMGTSGTDYRRTESDPSVVRQCQGNHRHRE
mgnify:CR=1 FL=1